MTGVSILGIEEGICKIFGTEVRAIVLRHPRNFGYGESVRIPFLAALTYSPDIVVTLDADGQDNSEECTHPRRMPADFSSDHISQDHSLLSERNTDIASHSAVLSSIKKSRAKCLI